MKISLLNIADLDKIKSKIDGQKNHIDVYYHISNLKYDSSDIKKIFFEKNFIVNRCDALIINESNQKKFTLEYISFLHDLGKVDILKNSLKNYFSFNNEISLWWLTKLSQKKKNKTIIPRYMEIIFLIKELVILNLKKKNKKEIFILSDDKEVISLIKKVLFNNLREKFDLTIKEYVTYYNNLQNFKRLFFFIKQKFINFIAILKNWSYLIKLFFFLKKLHISEEVNKGEALLFVDLEDLTVVDNKLYNRYFPNLKENFLKKNTVLNYIYVNKNSIITSDIDKFKNKISINYFNHYQHLYPGVKSFLILFVSSIKWFIFTKLLFLSKNFREVTKYHDASLKKYILQDFYQLAQIDGPKLIFKFLCWKKLIKKLQPSAVIYRKEFNSFGRIISAAAHKKTLMIGVQHGIVNDDQYGYIYKSEEIDNKPAVNSNFVKYCPCPDVVAVFGNRMKEIMTSYGFPEEKISVIGSLRHLVLKKNTYPLTNFKIRQDTLIKHDIPYQKKIITLICGFPEIGAKHLDMMIQASKIHENEIFFIIKPHPLMIEKTERFINLILEKHSFHNYKFLTGKIEEVLYMSDIAIVHSSTVGLDSIFLGVPVIIINDGLENNNVYRSSKAFFEAQNPKNLNTLFSKIFDKNFDREKWNSDRTKFLDYHLMNSSINPYDKLIKLIKK